MLMKSITAVLLALTCLLVQAEKPKEFVIVPSKGDGPFPVALWLHGYRGYSEAGYFPGETRGAMQ